MKYCEEYAALLDGFVDGELPPEEMARVRAHLEVCPGCQAYVDDALAIRAGFPDAEDTEMPEGFAEGVMERVRRDAERKRKAVELRRRSVRRWAGTFGALAACCALMIVLKSSPGDDAKVAMARGAGPAFAEDVQAAVTTGGDEEAPADCGMDTGGISPQMEMGPEAAVPEEEQEAAEGRSETRVTSMDRENSDRDAAKMANSSDYGDLPAAAAPAETASAAAEDAVEGGEAALCLTAEEAGELLDGFAPVWEDSVSSRYELDAEAYRALLEALGRSEEPGATGEGTFVVVVNWAAE